MPLETLTKNVFMIISVFVFVGIGTVFSKAAETTLPANTGIDACYDGSSAQTTDFLSNEDWRRLPRQERQTRFRQAFLAKIEPSGQGTPGHLADYVQRYKAAVVFDKRLCVFQVQAVLLDAKRRTIALKGEVSLPQYGDGLVNTLLELGFHVEHREIEILPAHSLSNDLYAIATTTAATMRREPRPDAEQVNSIALGWPLRLLRQACVTDIESKPFVRWPSSQEESSQTCSNISALSGEKVTLNDWFLAQSADGYVGFVRRNDIRSVSDYTLPTAIVGQPTTVTIGQARMAVLPMGTGLRLSGVTWKVLLGESEIVLPGNHQLLQYLPFVLTPENIEATAKPLLGTKYVWGGVTEHGIDCSGFTQLIYRRMGIHLPRDAEEQAIVGTIVAWGAKVVEHAQPGDLIFFVNEYGKISHVAISLGGERIIHSSQQDVHVGSLNEQRESTGERLIDRVVFARRVAGLNVVQLQRMNH